MPVLTSSQSNRFLRNVQQNVYYKINNENTECKRYIKVMLDLQPDNYEDIYDYYDSGKYNDNREEKVNSLIDELHLYREITQNSKPITRNLNESQERKRCTKKITQNVGSINHQLSKVNSFKPIVNNRRSELNTTNESISTNYINELNLKDSKNQITGTNDSISNKLNNLSVVTIQENKYISTSPLPEENEHILFSKETIRPVIISSTYNNKSNSSMIHDNYKLKLTNKEYTDQEENIKEENIKGYEDNNKNQDEQFEPTINNFPSTSIFESNKKTTADLNDALIIKYPDSIVESNIQKNQNNSKTDDLDGKVTVENSILDEKENISLDDNVNCTCNKKINKDISSSKIMNNITDVKTDKNVSLNSSNINGHELLDEINMTNNTINEKNIIDNKNNLNSSLLGKKPVTYKSTNQNNLKESNENLLQESMLNNDDNLAQNRMQVSRTNNFSKSSLFEFRIPELKLKGQRKRNNNENINDLEEINNKKMSLVAKKLPQNNSRQFVTKLIRFPQKDETSTRNNYRENNNMGKTTTNKSIFTKSSALMLNKEISRPQIQTIPEISSKQVEYTTKKTPRELVGKVKYNSKIRTASSFGDCNNDIASTEKLFASPKMLPQVPIKRIMNHPSETTEITLENDDIDLTTNSLRKLITESDKYISFIPNTRIVKTFKENNNHRKKSSRKDSLNINNLDLVQLQKPSSLVETTESSQIQMIPKNKIVNIYSTKIPTSGRNINKRIIINKNTLKSKISKPAQLMLIPKRSSSSDTTILMKNDNMSILEQNISLNNAKIKTSSVPLFLDKIHRNKNNHFNRPLTLALKNKNSLNDQSPIERGSIGSKKIDTKQNSEFNDDADSKAMLKSYPLDKSQVEDPYDDEHAPYTNEDLEPIIFYGQTQKPKISNKNFKFVIQSPISRQSLNINRKYNKSDVKLSQPAPINRPEYGEKYDSQRNGKLEVNGKNQKYQPAFDRSNNVPINIDMTDNDKYDVKTSEDESLNPNRFEIISQTKIVDGVFKIPLVSHTSIDNNGSEYVSDIFIPIEKPDGRHSVISLTKLLTGDFKLLNGHEEVHLSSIKPTAKMDPTLSSMRISTVRSDVIDDPINPNLIKILQGTNDNEKLTAPNAPIHIIQIINNGQCSHKHNDTDTVQKSEPDNDKHTYFNKSRIEGRRLSSIRSQNIPKNNKPINRKINNAYNHFDSEILDRFLQVYSPHLV